MVDASAPRRNSVFSVRIPLLEKPLVAWHPRVTASRWRPCQGFSRRACDRAARSRGPSSLFRPSARARSRANPPLRPRLRRVSDSAGVQPLLASPAAVLLEFTVSPEPRVVAEPEVPGSARPSRRRELRVERAEPPVEPRDDGAALVMNSRYCACRSAEPESGNPSAVRHKAFHAGVLLGFERRSRGALADDGDRLPQAARLRRARPGGSARFSRPQPVVRWASSAGVSSR